MPGSVGRGWALGSSPRTRWLAAAVALVGLAGPAAAQTALDAPPTALAPIQTVSTPGPGTVGWPTEAAPSIPFAPGPGAPHNALEGPLIPYTPPVATPPPVAADPLPGSLEEQVGKDYAARRAFRTCTWRGTTISAFPSTLLWTPALASLREPRFQLYRSSLGNYASPWTLDTSIGNTVGLFRFDPPGHDWAFQFDGFAVVQTRLSPQDLLAADYRFGFPVSVKWGDWHAKLGYEHTSAHLGDERILHFQSQFNPPQATFIPSFAKDEVVFGLGRWLYDQVRVYGQVSYAFLQAVPAPAKSQYRFDAGFEWFCPYSFGASGQPFVAVNLDTRGDENYAVNYSAQAGWMWRNPYQRLTNARFFLQYYAGQSPFNQLYQTREKFYAVGFSVDY